MRAAAVNRHSPDVRRVLALLLCAMALMAAPPSDAQIEADIRARLGKSKISTDGFQVKVRNGTAILTGRTDVMQHKGVATRMAKAGGATKVENRIEISDAAKAKASEHLARARDEKKLTTRTEPRSEPRTASRSDAPHADAPPAAAPAPPPVRRAVVKH